MILGSDKFQASTNHDYTAALQKFWGSPCGAFSRFPARVALLAVVLAFSLAVALVTTGEVGGGGVEAGESGQTIVPNPQLYLTPDGIWPILDLAASVSVPGHAFAQSVTQALNLTAAGSITNADTLKLDGAQGITTFTSGNSTYAAVASIIAAGVQILDVTNPFSITAAGGINGTDFKMDGAWGIVTFESGDSTYAAVASNADHSVQILDVTNPFSITAAGSITDAGALRLKGASDIAVFESGDSTYAAVASSVDKGVQILNITDPFSITAAGSIANNNTLELDGAQGIATFTSGDSTYAAVAAYLDDGVQILNITDPFSITAAGSITDAGALRLEGAWDITTFESGDSTYAAVTSNTYSGVQILDVTNPSAITAAGNITGTYALSLAGAEGIATFAAGGSTYAAVAAYSSNGVQILDITDPFSITAAGSITDAGALELFGASSIAVFESGDSTYAAVTAYADDGVQILRLAGDGSRVTLNSPPVLDDIADQEVEELQLLAFDADATDDDASDILTFSLVGTVPVGASIDPDTGVFSWVPGADQDGEHVITVRVSDGIATDFEGVTVTVTDSATAFVTTWQTTLANDTITIPVGNATGNYTVHWGDGTSTTHVTDAVHAYAEAGSYTVGISGDFTRIRLDGHADASRLASIDQWGDIRWESMERAFRGASDMEYSATDAPDLSRVTNMNRMFWNASAFNGNVSGWNVSRVTDMAGMFEDASAFNGDLSGWNVSRVTDMANMFQGATLFKQNLGTWYVVPADTHYYNSEASLNVTTVAAQNQYLDGENPEYGIGGGHNYDSFNMTGSTLFFKSAPSAMAYQVNVTVAGSGFGTNNHRILNVTVTGTNAAPVLDDIADQEVEELQLLAFDADATDDDAGDILTFSLVGTVPVGASIDPDTGAFSWVPGADQSGTHVITVRVSDGIATDSEEVTVTVTDSATAFVTTWQTTLANDTITIPVGNATGNYTVHWGDGTSTTHVTDAVHAYAEAGSYTVGISGNFTRIHLGDSNVPDAYDNAGRLASIVQWGDMEWATMEGAFANAFNMAYNATDAPDLSNVSSMRSMFEFALAFNGNVSGWDVSGVTDMNGMFQYASAFNGNVSGWDVSGVTGMNGMFSGASAFNGNVSGWDVSGVTDMNYMFQYASAFNGNVSGWDVSGVTGMNGMFSGASAFNGNVSGWDVSGVTGMNGMFRSAASFNADISGWNVSGVTGMNGMFRSAASFNADISGWNVSGVTDMAEMFRSASAFNADISGWNVSSVDNMYRMFRSAASFNADISGWNVSKVANMKDMFRSAASFNADISGWNVSSVTNMDNMFNGATAFDQNLGGWYVVLNSTSINAADAPGVVGTISAQNPTLGNQATYGIGAGGDSGSFNITGGSDLNMNISSPAKSLYTVNITSTGNYGTNNHRVYNVTVTGLDTTPTPPPDDAFVTTWEVETSPYVIHVPVEIRPGATATIAWGDGSTTDVSADGTQQHAYAAAGNYTVAITGGLESINLGQNTTANAAKLKSIDRWGSIGWTTMEGAFQGASNMVYNATDAPDLSQVTDMSSMFYNTRTFNGDISTWNTSSVTNMTSMFSGANLFNGDISTWNTSSVTNMYDMFSFAEAFNGDLSDWDTSSVTNMYYMFYNADKFNGDISTWNTSSVTTMSGMFESAPKFNGDISTWNTSSVTGMFNMFNGADVFNQDISGWDVSSVDNMASMFDDADAFEQNLGPWYITPDSVDFSYVGSLNVTDITPQNNALAGHNPGYGIGTGGNFTLFEIVSGSDTLAFKATPTSNGLHNVNVTAAGDSVFENGNNHRMVRVAVSGIQIDSTPPSLASVSRDTPGTVHTSAAALVFNATFSEPVTNVGVADFTVTGTGTGTVSGVSGDGASYLVTVTVDTDGTIGLDIASGHDITDIVGNPLTTTAITPNPDESFTVDTAQFTPSIRANVTSPTNQQSITFTVDFGEPINATTFTASDVDESQGTVSAPDTTDNQTFEFTITGLTEGNLTVSIPAGTVDDLAENKNLASDILALTIDTTAPSLSSISRGSPATELTSETSLEFAVDFSEPVTGVDTSDFTVSGNGTGSVSGISGSGSSYTVTVDVTSNSGTIGLVLVASNHDIIDSAGTALTDTSPDTDETYTIDAISPSLISITRNSPTTAITSETNLNFTVTFSESVINVSPTDFVLYSGTGTGTGTITVSPTNASSYVVAVAVTADGTINLDVASGHDITDIAGNPLTATAPNPDDSFTVDTAQPTPSISTDTASPTNQQSITFTVDFGEPINATTFTASDVDESQGTVSAPDTTDNQTFEFTITGLTEGTLTVSIPAGTVDDLAENKNLASEPTTITIDTTAPSLSSISRGSPATELTSETSLGFAVAFSEAVTNVDSTDFVLSSGTGTGTGTITVSPTNASSYVVAVAVTADGTIDLDVASGHDITDIAGNPLTATAPNPDDSFTVDTAQPTPSISTDTASPTNQQSITFTVDFGEPINATTFTASDVDESQGTVSAPATTDNQTFTFEITGLTTGNLTVSIPAGAVDDPAENKNLASNTFTIAIDTTAPSLSSITRSSPTVEITSLTSLDFAVTFSESVINVSPTDFVLSSGTGTITVSPTNASSYVVTVAVTADGIIDLDAASNHDITDFAGNPLPTATTPNPDESFTVDFTRFTPLISTDTASPTNQQSITFTVDFGEPINATTFTASDIDESQGTVSAPTTNNNQTFAFDITGLAEGTLTVSIPAGTVDDLAENKNLASDPTTITIDTTAPSLSSITRSSPASALTYLASLEFAVVFNEPVINVSLADFAVTGTGNGPVSGVSSNGDGASYTVTVAVEGIGIIGLDIAPGHDIKDAAQNSLTDLTTTDSDETYTAIDNSLFLTTWETTAANPTVSIPVEVHSGETFTIDWGDGSTTATVNSTGTQSHTYATAGSYWVIMTGDLSRINLGGSGSTPALLSSINQWGDIRWSTMSNAFRGANAMTYHATDTPNLSQVTDTSGMFQLALKFNGDISGWDTSSVTDMSYMFSGANVFNRSLVGWNTSSVTDMSYMFSFARAFNGDISGWDTSSVTDMSQMFAAANAFNGDISGWDTSSVTYMPGMFDFALKFNRDISGWNVSSVTDMDDMFSHADDFDQNLGPWYITPDSVDFSYVDSLNVTDITPQNNALAGHNPVYGIGTGGNFTLFEIVSGSETLAFKAIPTSIDAYSVNVTASDGTVFEDGNNHRVIQVTVSDILTDTTPPRVASILRDTPSVASTTATTLVFAVTFDEPVTNVGVADFAVTGTGNGTVSAVSGSGASYRVTVTVTASGTIGLDIASGHDIQDTATNGLTNLTPTGSDETYTVTETTVPDTTPPRVASILRDTPSVASTTATTLVFAVTFDEPVTNVGVADFAVTGTGNGTVSGVSGSGASYRVTVTVTASGTIGLDIASGHDIQDTATNGLTNLTPTGSDETYTVTETTVPDTTPPRVASILRDTPSVASTTATTLVFAVTFDEPVTNVGVADFAVTGTGNGTVSGVSGSGASYRVTVTVTASGTIGLDIASGHDIQDTATNGLTNLTPTGSDETYTVTETTVPDTTPPRVASILRDTPSVASTTATTLVFAVTFDEPVTNVGVADFAVTGTGTGTISAVSGSGASYRVTVTVTASGTIGLDIASGHDIQDTATNGLTNLAPTGSDQTYTVNQLPVLNNILSQAVNELVPLTFTAEATDPDSSDTLTYSLIGTIPEGATMASSTGLFSWTPTEAQDGTHTVTVQVSDGNGGSDSETFTITVREVNVDPVLNPIGSQNVDELDSLTFTATATDADFVGGTANTLTFSLTDNPPRGVSITPGGVFTWTPDQSQDGDHTITVRVSDGRGGTDSEIVDVTVNDIEPMPVSARFTGSSITLTLSEAVRFSAPAPNGFAVSTQNGPVAVASISGNDTAALILGTNSTVSGTATLSYNAPPGDVADRDGEPLASFADLAVSFPSKSRSSATPPPVIISSPDPSGVDPEPGRPLQAVQTDGAPALPLVIDGNGYALQSRVSTLVPTVVTADQQVTIKVTVHDPTPIAYFAIYLNLQGSDVSHLDSDAQVIWNYGQTYVVDRSGLMRDAAITMSGDPDDASKKTFTVTVTLSEEMGESNMAIRTWNAAGHLTEVQIFDALDVRAPEPEPAAVDPEPAEAEPEPAAVDPEPAAVDGSAGRDLLAIRMWSGFEPESISDAQLLASLGLDYPGADIPSWVMTELGPLAAKGDITIGEFKTALTYVLENA